MSQSPSKTTNDDLVSILSSPDFLGVTLSPPKTTIMRISGKKGSFFQLSEQKGAKIFHTNLDQEACCRWFLENLPRFRQALFKTAASDFQLLLSKKGKRTLLCLPASRPTHLSHNRVKKSHIPQETAKWPTLFSASSDKKKQVEKFLSEVDAILPAFGKKKSLHIVDLGCGKGYLTFALYEYLSARFSITLRGIDIKSEVVEKNRLLAQEAGLTTLFFENRPIEEASLEGVDLAVSLHACDVATDFALAKAVKARVKVILAAPCCQHELRKSIHQKTLDSLLRHPILRERFSALVTDAARAELLELEGYETAIVEFIQSEHTPKNLLLRAILSEKKELTKARHRWRDLQETLSISPILESLLNPPLPE